MAWDSVSNREEQLLHPREGHTHTPQRALCTFSRLVLAVTPDHGDLPDLYADRPGDSEHLYNLPSPAGLTRAPARHGSSPSPPAGPHPAGPAGALVSDLFDGRAVRPLFPGIEVFRQNHVLRKPNPR